MTKFKGLPGVVALGCLWGLVWSINKKQIIRKKQFAPKKVKIVGGL